MLAENKADYDDLHDLVIDNDTGARRATGLTLKLTLSIALCWSLFQIWVASPLPFVVAEYVPSLRFLVIDATRSRYIHLSFAMLLVYLSYPATKKSSRDKVPVADWCFAIVATFSSLYLLVFYNDLAGRAGMATKFDVAISIVGIALLIEATRRALGPPLAIIASVFLFYTYAGQYMPEVLVHKGHNLTKIASHQWLATEGVFGIALGVSTGFVFLFVLFGALLEKAGAGNYFIKVAFSLLGHFKGGPAKAAVLSSAMTGLISGSSIANVVTTGTFTVPLMRKVGFSREKSGSVEVASSVNGQLMPPVMGAAAFLMVEYIGIPYVEVIKHAFVPAIISYIALLYIVHLEALKLNMKTLPKRNSLPFTMAILRSLIILSSIIIVAAICYYVFMFLKTHLKGVGVATIMLIILSTYVFLIKIKSGYPDLDDNPDKEMTELPEVGPTVKSGLHYILPIMVLIWCLMIERFSPGLASFWATTAMMFIMMTQKPLTNYFRNKKNYHAALKEGFSDLVDGLITGARNMAGIGVATAAAGIIVGVVTQTGVGNKMTEIVSIVAGDSIMIMLLFTAFICIILGMGLPTTANYIVVSSLMASVVVELGKQNGLIIPLVAVHFFVFYFGIMADVTPPVGLASFAAAAVSGGDPIRTSFQAFLYSMRTMILPFLFIFDNRLLLIGVDSFLEGTIIFIKATFAILIFSSATQGFLVVRNKIRESILLLVVSMSLFMPSLVINRFVAPEKTFDPSKIYEIVNNLPSDESVKLEVLGLDFLGDEKKFFIDIKFDDLETAEAKLDNYGISLYENDENKMLVSIVRFGSPAHKDGLEMDFEIRNLSIKQKQPSNFVVYIPAIVVLMWVYYMQVNRKRRLKA